MMKVKSLYFVAIFSALFIPLSPALSCMYNVRDVGFSDIGSVSYQLIYYVKDDTPEELTSAFSQISYAALMDSNIAAEMINVDRVGTSPDAEADDEHAQAMKYLKFWNIKSFPAAIMVSPDGRSIVLPVPDKAGRESLWSLLEEAVLSPKREEIISSVVDTYCAILLIQGDDAAENTKVEKAVKEAIDEISKVMNQMPKPLENPPQMFLISRKSFDQERVLLWSLGVEPSDGSDSKPYVAVIYGRGRRIGPLLAGEKITKSSVLNIISVIGESCECGLDRSYMLGTMIPLRWDEKIQSKLAKLLGFDVGNPMIKTEMAQILSAGSGAFNATNALSGYRETVVEFEEEAASSSTISPAQLASMRSSSRTDTEETRILPYRMTLLIGIGVAVLVIIAAGAIVLLRARRRVS